MRDDVVFYTGKRLEVPDGYYLKKHPTADYQISPYRNGVSLIKMRPHVYVADIREDEKEGFIAVFLSGRANDKHVLKDTDLNALVLKACAYDRLTSTVKG